MDNQPQKNDFVKVACWTGRVINVFRNGDETNPLYQIRFVKNIVKQQGDEFHPWTMLQPQISTATEKDLADEYEQMVRAQHVRWCNLLV